jgi:type IV secretion system protein VirB10
MNESKASGPPSTSAHREPGNTVSPLDGEAGIPSVSQPRTVTVSRKGVFAVGLLAVTLIAFSAISISRVLSDPTKDGDEASKLAGQRPSAAAAEPRRLDLTLPLSARAPASAAAPGERMIPAILPLPDDARPEPIQVRRIDAQRIAPEDAPAVLLASRPNSGGAVGSVAARQAATASDGTSEAPDSLDSTRRNLDAYQQQLQGLLDTLIKSTDIATRPGTGSALPAPAHGLLHPATGVPPASTASGLFGGQLLASATPRVAAGVIGNRSLTLPKGTAFTCALKTKIISAAAGFVSCQVQRNVFGEDGRVLLVERGSHLDGEYRVASVRPGTVRIPVLWTRIRTPNAVTVDIESPGTGPLGESGVDGHVDNRWVERIGAALLLSLINNSVKLIVQNQSNDAEGSTVILPSTTSSSSKLAEKVLDSTINIPPLIYQNQGGIVGIYVARDVDFSSVYELKAVQR